MQVVSPFKDSSYHDWEALEAIYDHTLRCAAHAVLQHVGWGGPGPALCCILARRVGIGSLAWRGTAWARRCTRQHSRLSRPMHAVLFCTARMYRRDQMRLRTEDHPVILAEPTHNSREARERIVQLMFEKYNAPGEEMCDA